MILLLGADLDVARGLALGLEARGRVVVHAPEVDVSSMRAVRAEVVKHKPAGVVLVSGLEDPEAAESDPDRAFTVNAEGAIHLGAACLEVKARAVLLSTAEVFGQRGGPWTESDEPEPASAWARTKRKGEALLLRADPKALVLRTGPLLGARLAAQRARLIAPVEEADDELVQPIAARQVGEAIDALISGGASGLFHLVTPDPPISRADLLRELATRVGLSPDLVLGMPARRLVRGAVRAPKQVLFGDKLCRFLAGGLGSWRDAVQATPNPTELTTEPSTGRSEEPSEGPSEEPSRREEPRAMGQRYNVRRVDKPWGHEIIWAHTERYVGKLLFVKSGERLSLQYHEKKDETIYVLSGKLMFEVGPKDQPREDLVLKPGDAYHITPLTTHRMIAIEDTTILEASTPELDDVVRLEDKYGRTGTNAP